MNRPSTQLPVETLIEEFRLGKAEAGDVLLRRFEPWLRLLARHQVESRFQAKFDPADIVQQSLAEATRAFPGFRGRTEAELAAWLRTILAHVVAHEVRRYAGTDKRDVDRERSIDAELAETSQRWGDLLAASGSSPTQKVVRRERAAAVAEVLERLPEDYRTVLVLRHFDGLSHEAIAVRMGRGSGAVRMLWVRALARLREEMERSGWDA